MRPTPAGTRPYHTPLIHIHGSRAQQFDWVIAAKTDTPATVTPENQYTYDLFNITTAEALKYSERKFGINLVWTDPHIRTTSASLRKPAARCGT